MRSRLVIGVLALAGLAGCGGSSDDAPTPSASAAPGTAVPSPTIPSASPTAPQAADGTKLSACRDGRCEVIVSAGDKISGLTRFGLEQLTVKTVSPDGVTYVGTGPGITLSAGRQQPGMTSRLNRLAITTVAINGDKAIVRLKPR
jgi:hypothetical protein